IPPSLYSVRVAVCRSPHWKRDAASRSRRLSHSTSPATLPTSFGRSTKPVSSLIPEANSGVSSPMRDITDIRPVRPGTNLLQEFGRVFVKDSEIPKQPIHSADGVSFKDADVQVKLLMVGDRMHMLKVYFNKGTTVPVHVHNDHSTIVCL